MGSWDVYCALCCGPLGNFVKLGSRNAKKLKHRRNRVAVKKRRHAGAQIPEIEAEDESTEEESEDSGGEVKERDDEIYRYDPELLSEKDTAWLDNCRSLGFNENAQGWTKAFISAKGYSGSYGEFYIERDNNQELDPNDPGADKYRYQCYTSYDEAAVFPFHETCYEILVYAVTGELDTQLIDKDALYSAMAQIHAVNDSSSDLGLDYGPIEGGEQFWVCWEGEEYSVCDPAFRPGLSEILEDMLPARLLTKSSFTLDLSAKVSNDPFSRLPYDILLMIIDRLPVSRVRSLMGASYHVFTQARSDKFWRSMIRKRFSPCFRELNEFLDKVQSLDGSFDFCKMFWWLDECTRPKYGLTGPLMGLANRRRIWNAVKEIIPLYVERESKAKINGGEDELAKEILDNAKSLHMPVVCFPKPPSVRTTSTQLIRSWNEVNVREWDLEVSFNEAGTLVGLGVKFGEDRRTFGMHQETAHGVSTQSTSMYHLDWIREIVLYTRDVDMFSEPLKRVSSGFSPWKSVFVEAVSISSILGGFYHFGAPAENLNQRVLLPTSGTYIVGLVGEVASDGPITRLGVLQTYQSSTKKPEPQTLPPLSLQLWSPASVARARSFKNTPPWDIGEPCGWNQAAFRVLPMPPVDQPHNGALKAMLPYHLLLWVNEGSDFKKLCRISANQVYGGLASDGDDWWPQCDIIGFKCEHVSALEKGKDHSTTVGKTIGNGGPVPYEDPEWAGDLQTGDRRHEFSMTSNHEPWSDISLSHFDIDGEHGELITEVHIAGSAKALKLRTNRGRQCYWGEEKRGDSDWTIQRAPEGEVIGGLLVCFGCLGGMRMKDNLFSHWKTTMITSITMPVPYQQKSWFEEHLAGL